MNQETPSAGTNQQLLQAIEQATQRIVASDEFIDRLARAIEQRITTQSPRNYGELDVACDANTAEFGRHVVAEPQPTAAGHLVVLSQVPVRDGLNVLLTLQLRSPTLLDSPTPEGERLRNYSMSLMVEERLGDLSGRRFFSFDAFGEDAQNLAAELNRQLETLPLEHVAFLYLNVLQRQAPEQPQG